MTARNFKAMAHRSEGWWALEVTGGDLPHPAYTQARRLDQAEEVVRDLLALHFGTSQDAVGQIEVVPVLDTALAEEVSQTRHAREQAERLRADASAQTRRTAQHLREQGMAQRDISALLGISHQAVSQLRQLKLGTDGGPAPGCGVAGLVAVDRPYQGAGAVGTGLTGSPSIQ